MNSAGNLRPKTVALAFSNDYFHVGAFPQKWTRMFSLYMELNGRHLDWQVASAAQVFRSLSTVFSAVEHLTLHHDRHSISSEWNNEADITQWRELLGCFNNVKTLRVGNAGSYSLIEQLSRALQPDKGGPTALLPALQELTYSPTVVFPNAFTPFIDARQKAGCPRNGDHSLRNGSFDKFLAAKYSIFRTTGHAPVDFIFPTVMTFSIVEDVTTRNIPHNIVYRRGCTGVPRMCQLWAQGP